MAKLAKSVLSKDEAENVAILYNPRKFPSVVTPTASEFVALQSSQIENGFEPSFRIDKIVAQQTGVAELERISIEEKVEREALNRVKDLQEQGYAEAYQLGLEEGREMAFKARQVELDEKLKHFEQLLGKIETLKTDLIHFNESHVVRLVFFMARRLVFEEVSTKPELVLNVIKQAMESAQSDEALTVRVSQSDFAFIEEMKEKLGKEFENLKHAKLESSEEIQSGGCIVETNYGDVDATIEQRLEKLWEAVSEKLPKVKSTVRSE